MKLSSVCKRLSLVLLLGVLIFSFAGYSKSYAGRQGQPEGYPIASDVVTTLQKTVVPDPVPAGSKVRIEEISKFRQNGYGTWRYGPGLPPESLSSGDSPSAAPRRPGTRECGSPAP